MESLFLDGNRTYPTVVFDSEAGYFEISGKSVMDESELFFRPVLSWLDEYAENPNAITNFIFKLDYFNIASSKRLLFILYKLFEMQHKGYSVRVSWYYEEYDDDMLEAGQDFGFMVAVPFDFVPYRKPLEARLAV
ncbi:MAG: nuclear pore complex subunit [Flavobacteriales bacterium]|nr:MAG: nuclear pore complex subunit [Flavobacteriales bacterium]